ncbi:hypothetical protein [Myxococcus virescens]|uniref:PAS domain-containing protein n=1 Tax=Myxococcus virescens TaxID=83456 RepID=A0A511HHI7_9BACT|nr:hypothetical protein [Myxococcus virescens]GEL72844.1 hypothetical protein MVI01_46280 [Myxococcus virescens]SDF13877.1 hypothetical protein SAMN04488504_12151 [Myxococcus virescens]
MLDPRMRWRIVRSARRIISTSSALYLLALVFMTTSAVCARESVSQVFQNLKDINFEIDNHLRYHPDVDKHEPDDPGILSFTFDAAQVSPDRESTARARGLARRIEDAFSSVVQDMVAAEDPGCSNGSPLPRSVKLLGKSLPDTMNPKQSTQWEEALSEQICNYRKCPYADSIRYCPEEKHPPRPDTFASDPLGCDLTPELKTRLFVPTTLDNCLSEQVCTPQHKCSDKRKCQKKPKCPDILNPNDKCGANCFSCRSHEAATISRPLDIVIHAFANQQCEFAEDESSLTSVYFTTPEGIIRQWSCTPAPGPPAIHFSEFAAQASYVRRLFKPTTMSDYETDIYLDSNGFGPIRTRCVRIEKPHAQQLLGVLCFDFTVSLNQFLEPLIRSNVIAIDEARVIMPDAGDDITVTGHWTFVVPETQLIPIHMARKKVASDEATRGSFEQDLQHTFDQITSREDNASTTLRRFERSVTQLSSVADPARLHDGRYLIPGGWSADGRSRKLLIVRPAVTTLRGAKVFGGVAVAFFLLTLLTVWRGSYWTRRMSENELVVELLRKLGIGIMLVDEDGMVMAANDAAEDIVRLFLPRLNTWRLRINEGFRQKRLPSDPAVRMADFIDPDVILAQDMSKVPYKDVWEQRLRGQPATFYARMKKHNGNPNWVKVTAAPVVIKRAGKKTRTTSLSVVESIPSINAPLLGKLNNIMPPVRPQ